MENQGIEIIIGKMKHIVSMDTIRKNFEKEEFWVTRTEEEFGEEAVLPKEYSNFEEYVELLKIGQHTDGFNTRLGTKYYLANFFENFEGLKKVIQFCKENDINIETHERVHRD